VCGAQRTVWMPTAAAR